MDIEWDINMAYSLPKETYTFRSEHHRFRAMIDREQETLNVIGIYPDYADITIYYTYRPDTAFITHIESYHDCSLDTFMNSGSEMLQASIQFVSIMFPNILYIRLDDMYVIYPNKINKQVSLAHLSIATNEYTWYEKNFGAIFIDPTEHQTYRNRLLILHETIPASFDEFAKRTYMSFDQKAELEKYYKPGNTWITFFKSIPIEKRCALFFDWLSSFLSVLTSNAFVPSQWVIDISKMPKTTIEIEDQPSRQSVHHRTTRHHTRRRKRNAIRMSNARYQKVM